MASNRNRFAMPTTRYNLGYYHECKGFSACFVLDALGLHYNLHQWNGELILSVWS